MLPKRQMIPSMAWLTCLPRHGARRGAGRGEHLRPLEPPDVPRAGPGQGDLVTLLRPGAGLLPHRARHQDTGRNNVFKLLHFLKYIKNIFEMTKNIYK